MEKQGFELIFVRDAQIGARLLGSLDVRLVPERVSHKCVNLKDSIDEWEMFGAKVEVNYTATEEPRAVSVYIAGYENDRNAARNYLEAMAGGALN